MKNHKAEAILHNAIESLKDDAINLNHIDFCHRYIKLAPNNAIAGEFSYSRQPASIEPAMQWDDGLVNQIAVMASTQFFKTQLLLNRIAQLSMTSTMPSLLIEPDENLLRDIFDDRISPLIRNLPFGSFAKTEHLSKDGRKIFKKVVNNRKIMTASGFSILGVSADSKTGTASRQIKDFFGDEIDKNKIDLTTDAMSRVSTFGNRAKIYWCSSPENKENSKILARWLAGSQGIYNGLCDCGEFVPLIYSSLNIPKDDNGNWIVEKSAILCPSCKRLWSENDRKAGVKNGKYIHKNDNPNNKTYWATSLANILGRFAGGDPMKEILDDGATKINDYKKTGDDQPIREWFKQTMGEPYHHGLIGRSAKELVSYFIPTNNAKNKIVVPAGTLAITAGVDIQRGANNAGLYCSIYAFSLNQDNKWVATGISNFVVSGDFIVDDDAPPAKWSLTDKTFIKLYNHLFTDRVFYHPALQKNVRIASVIMDSGDGELTNKVRGWCDYGNQLLNLDAESLCFIASKGRAGYGNGNGYISLQKISDKEKMAELGEQLGGAIIIYTDAVKNDIFNIKRIDDISKEKRINFYQDAGFTESVMREIFESELPVLNASARQYRFVHNRVICNERLDCLVYALAGISWLASVREGVIVSNSIDKYLLDIKRLYFKEAI